MVPGDRPERHCIPIGDQMTVTDTTGFEALQRELQQKLGRNLLRFQHIEQLLKTLLISAEMTTVVRQGRAELLDRAGLFENKTMGPLLQQFFDDLFRSQGDRPEEKPQQTSSDVIRMTTSFHFGSSSDDADLNQLLDEFRAMLIMRNDMVHSFLSRYDFSSCWSGCRIETRGRTAGRGCPLLSSWRCEKRRTKWT